MKSGKAASFDGFYTEFLKNFKTETKLWLLTFYNSIFNNCKLPKEFKRAKILGDLRILVGDDPVHYRPISLLSILYKLFEKLILNRIKPFIE